MKRIVAIVLLLLLTGCYKDPIATVHSNNKAFNIELLFENDGCKVYRFLDSSYVYYVVCKGQVQTSWEQHVGKRHFPRTVQTITED